MTRNLPALIVLAGLLVLTESCRASETGPGAGQVPRLAGTVIGPLDRQALLHFEPSGRYELLERGDTFGAWTVERIEPGRILLTGPAGAAELTLSGGNVSPPAAAAAGPEETTWRNPCGRIHGRGPRFAGDLENRDLKNCRAIQSVAGSG